MKTGYVYDRYYGYDEITGILKGYQQKHPDFTELTSLGRTPEGREIWLLKVTDTSFGGYEDKPALYVEGNIHAGEVTGSMTVMYLIDTLMSNLEDKNIARLLEKYTIYAVPRVSPDGSERYLTTPDTLRSAPRLYPFSEPMPGLQRKDMDGDGVIRLMRVKTPYGAWKVSEKDARVMKRRQPDDTDGDFYNVYDEGFVENYDGINIEIAPAQFGNDFNRNYPIGWQTEDSQKGSGDYPLSNTETKANADFLIAHPNVCCVIDMHTAGGQNLYTPGYKSPKDAIKQDIDLYKAIGKIANQENGYPVLSLYEEYMPQSHPQTCGGFDDFCHFVLGIPAMTIECWDLAERSGLKPVYPPCEDKSDEEKEHEICSMLKWVDENIGKDVFMPWTSFDHPQLGMVELGGCDSKFVAQNPPPRYLKQELLKHTRFMLRLMKLLPSLTVDDVQVKQLGEDIFKVEVTCGNMGYMPTYVFKEGLKAKRLKGVSLQLDGIEVLEGPSKSELGHLEGHGGYSVSAWGVSQGTAQNAPLRKKAAWIVRGRKGDGFTIVCTSGKAGKTSVKAEL
ncbi:MAG: M14 family metallopeptidase [Clostridiaceae bacterium]|nr:M14 family metallopeptidase [Clostridiaceae bacterium]